MDARIATQVARILASDPRDDCPLVLRCMGERQWAADEELAVCPHQTVGACGLGWAQGRRLDCAFFDIGYRMQEKALGLVTVDNPGSAMAALLRARREAAAKRKAAA
jgi:hypothetical protein